MTNKLSTSKDWTFEDIEAYATEIHKIADEELKLTYYPNQIEIISAEQMLDAYSSVGLPVNYKHWSYGKDFVNDYDQYMNGRKGLAYEIVINSNPCIAYCMENNTLPMQALVIAHACIGHNAFFCNNYLFKERTQADTIIDYMCHARDTINKFEQQYGEQTVERFIDHVHALRNHSCDQYIRSVELSAKEQREQREQRLESEQLARNDLWDSFKPKNGRVSAVRDTFPEQPTENILKFFSQYAPNLEPWQREIIDIICYIQNYFYPQGQTQVANEGFATFTHRYIIERLYEKGLVDESFMQELILSHTNVILQPTYDKRYYSGINPYALGYAMYEDIRRICTEPTEEDRRWFPHLVDTDWVEAVKHAAFNFRDESFIGNYLSPKVMRDFKMFAHEDDTGMPFVEIVGTPTSDDGYRKIRTMLSEQKLRHNLVPLIEVQNVDIKGDRTLTLQHTVRNGVQLDNDSVYNTLFHVQQLWGFDVVLVSIDETDEIVQEWCIDKDEFAWVDGE
jgi:stage V sporulation protein R